MGLEELDSKGLTQCTEGLEELDSKELATSNIGTGIVITMRWVDWPNRDYNRLPSDRQVATG
jgi:hypothetical protein